MYTIWKYPLDVVDDQTVQMPSQAELLTVNDQNDHFCLWVRVNTDNPLLNRKISIRGTGHPADDVGKYIGSMYPYNGKLVFHVFDGGYIE